MNADQPTRITIEIRSCSGRIRGDVLDDQNRRLPFETWLSLFDLIRRAAETGDGHGS